MQNFQASKMFGENIPQLKWHRESINQHIKNKTGKTEINVSTLIIHIVKN